MSGSVEGGKLAAITSKAKYGENFYREIALKSQEAWRNNGRKPRGFSVMSPEKLSAAGVKGGIISRRRAQ